MQLTRCCWYSSSGQWSILYPSSHPDLISYQWSKPYRSTLKGLLSVICRNFMTAFFPLPALHWSKVSCGQAEDARKVKSVRKEHCLPAVTSVMASACFAIHQGPAAVEKPCSLSKGLPPPCLHRHVQSCALLWPIRSQSF